MLTAVTVFAIIAFVAATALFAVALTGTFDRGAVFGHLLMWPAAFAAAVVCGSVLSDGGGEALVDTRTVFLALTALLTVSYLVVTTYNESLRMLGAFVAPTAAALLGTFLAIENVSQQALTSANGVLVAHIVLATIGLGTFVLASCTACLYLLQERLIRARSFGQLFHRLPGLEVLDGFSLKLIVVGFVVFTAALAFGIGWAVQVGLGEHTLRIYLSVGAWLLFAIILYMRVRSGWRGTQAAWLTLVGTVSAVTVLGVYVIS